MKICYVGQFNTTSVGEPEVAKCLEQLGHEVIRLNGKETSIYTLRDVVIGQHCNMLLYAKFRINSTVRERAELLEELKRRKVPTVCWVFDLYFGV